MKRKYFSALLMGALTIASVSTFTSCKDYDDDISGLQSQIDELSKIIDQIKSQITAGSVITKVETVSDGVKITLSNDQSYLVKNGTNGVAGTNGTSWSISDDGYWVKDDVKTTMKALAEKGAPGAPGEPGAPGAPGEPGATGNYYKPNATTGNFDLCDANGNVLEQTNIAWKGTGVTAVMDSENLTLFNVADKNGNVPAEGVVISLSNNLRGLVFEKDNLGRVYVDGVPGIRVASFSYLPQKLANANSDTEMSVSNGDPEDVVNPQTYAYYHVNPSNVSVDQLKNLKFVVKANADYISTSRAAASEDFDAVASYDSFDSENGIVKVKVDMKGLPATKEKISVVALQATKSNNEKVTSDYATMYKQDMKQLRLANKAKFEEVTPVDYHYRRAAEGINSVDADAGISNKAVWGTQDKSDIDLDLQYDGSIDLNNYVQAHEVGTTKCSVADLDALNFGIKYEIVQNYKIGDNETDQAEFVNLKDGVLSAKVFTEASKKFAAVGRTPIVRAQIYNKSNNKVVEYAYIKVNIVKKAVENKEVSFGIGDFKFDCTANSVLVSTVEAINLNLYNEMSMDRDEFHNTYTYFDANNVTGQVGTVKERKETTAGETTHLIEWTMTPDEMWANADKDVTHECFYKVASTSNRWVKITLKAHVKDIKKVYDISKADFITEYWNKDKSYAKFNVATPEEIGSTDATKCVFVNDLNSPFTTVEGKLALDKNIKSFTYQFCKDIENVTKVGDIAVKFTVAGNDLKATVGVTTEVVATISNAGTAVPYNTVTLNKSSKIAKELLNTGEFKVYYSVKATVCEGNAAKEVKVTFDSKDHFEALFVRPVQITAKSKDNFIDGVDFGEKGTYLKLEDLIAPSDWRNRDFATYTNYWQYYGAFSIVPDTDHAECDLNGKRQAVPSTIKLEPVAAGTIGTGANQVTSAYGFISYKNNGTVLTGDFNIFVKVKVNYGWGTILTDWITVPVKKTIIK